MTYARHHTLAASLVALLAAAPALAQQNDAGAQGGTDVQPPNAQTGTETPEVGPDAAIDTGPGGDTAPDPADAGDAQTPDPAADMPQSTETDQEMPGASPDAAIDTGPGSDTAPDPADAGDAQTPDPAADMPQAAGESEAAKPQGQDLSNTAEVGTPPGPSTGQGRVMMLDIEGFSQQIYERGFRQGYIQGIADARDRLMTEIQRTQAARQGRSSQQGQSATGDQARNHQSAADSQDRGTIIILPPGMTPELFLQELTRSNNAAQRGD